LKAYLLDTDTCIYALKQSHGVLGTMLSKSRASIFVSVISESELRFGAAKSAVPAKNGRLVDAFLRPLQVLDFTSGDARAYAELRAGLERKGRPIGPLDTLIACQALARRLTLVTNNLREFSQVPALAVENWKK
jgi:tRNA(fMet)-specific endonuclease VapC